MSATAGGRGARRRPRRTPAFSQESLFDVEVRSETRYYRQMLDALARSEFGADGLAAEVTVSTLFGTVWAAQTGARDGAMEEAFGLGLVEHAGQTRTPAALALLRTVAVVAPIRQVREAAAAAADKLTADRVPGPHWTLPPGAVVPGRCWAYEDVFGDQTTIVSEFVRGSDPRGEDRHAIMVQIDHAMVSAATNAMLVDAVDATVRDLLFDAENSGPMFTLRQADPAWARALQERAFARTDLVPGVNVWPRFAEMRALALARVGTLAEAGDALPPDPPPPSPADRRAVVDEFLASTEAGTLPDPDYAARVAGVIVDHACTLDPADVARASPGRWESFLFEWWPTRAVPGDSLEAVLRAWSRWAGRRLPEPARVELAESLTETLGLTDL